MVCSTSLPLVTVAIPAYKATYLYNAIESVVRQTYPRLEIIVVDDCSPHDVHGVVERFDDERIVYHANSHNVGAGNPAQNWNKCLSLAHGDYFCLLCDDDVYGPEFVETMMGLAADYPGCNVFRARGCVTDKDGNETDWYPASPQYETALDYMWHTFNAFRVQTISEFCYRTSHIRECGGYALLPLAWYADYLSVFRFSMSAGIASTYKTLVCFRQSGENISSQEDLNTIRKIQATNIYVDEVSSLVKAMDVPQPLKQKLGRLLLKRTKDNTKWSLRHASKKTLFEVWRRRKELRIKASWVTYALFHHIK